MCGRKKANDGVGEKNGSNNVGEKSRSRPDGELRAAATWDKERKGPLPPPETFLHFVGRSLHLRLLSNCLCYIFTPIGDPVFTNVGWGGVYSSLPLMLFGNEDNMMS